MARIRTITYQMEKSMCGCCGIILSNRLNIFDRCPKCKEVIEAWSDNQYVEKAERVILENIFLELVIVQMMAPLYAAFVKCPGLINSIYSMWKDILFIPFFMIAKMTFFHILWLFRHKNSLGPLNPGGSHFMIFECKLVHNMMAYFRVLNWQN